VVLGRGAHVTVQSGASPSMSRARHPGTLSSMHVMAVMRASARIARRGGARRRVPLCRTRHVSLESVSAVRSSSLTVSLSSGRTLAAGLSAHSLEVVLMLAACWMLISDFAFPLCAE